MKLQTLQKLRQLRKRYDSGPFGKIAQKLLALSFREMGYTHIVERSIEGVDIDIAEEAGRKFALEVKTTDGLSISLSPDNIQSLRERVRDGYLPVIAALRLAVFENWILAGVPLHELSTGQVLIDRLRAYRMSDVENLLCPAFEQVVEKHFQGILKGGQRYLSEQLQQTGVEVRDF
jgi:Holliday junction resolvase